MLTSCNVNHVQEIPTPEKIESKISVSEEIEDEDVNSISNEKPIIDTIQNEDGCNDGEAANMSQEQLIDLFSDYYAEDKENYIFTGQEVLKCYTDLNFNGKTELVLIEWNGLAYYSDYCVYELNDEKNGLIKLPITHDVGVGGHDIVPDLMDYDEIKYIKEDDIYTYIACDTYYERGYETKTYILISVSNEGIVEKLLGDEEQYNDFISNHDVKTLGLNWQNIYSVFD